MVKVKVILNEQHSLMDEQTKLLNERFTKDGWEIYNVPENGWKLEEINKIANELCHDVVVFASPIPALMKDLTSYMSRTWYVFHNDNRVKKELPNGKIIMTVSPTGWTIV